MIHILDFKWNPTYTYFSYMYVIRSDTNNESVNKTKSPVKSLFISALGFVLFTYSGDGLTGWTFGFWDG